MMCKRAVAVDGKTSRGARRADGTRVHLLGVAEHGGPLLDHLEVDVKHNETSHFTELLEPLDLAGAVVTFDALHTVRANLDWLAREKKAHYIAVIKQNQPLLHARVKAMPWRQVPAGSITRDTGHGRTETRTLKTAHVSGLDFPHACQAIKICRWRKDTATGKVSRETAYAVTGLTSADATAPDLARLVREHWSIEAHHHIRSPGVLSPLHDVAVKRFTESFCNTSAKCGARCRRCSEPCHRGPATCATPLTIAGDELTPLRPARSAGTYAMPVLHPGRKQALPRIL
jgi:predicted transposase YbfD/YdcC